MFVLGNEAVLYISKHDEKWIAQKERGNAIALFTGWIGDRNLFYKYRSFVAVVCRLAVGQGR